ncbi:MAG TPA: Rieske (2Fe-2S) protein [Kofleriaceae bacterium]|nr:Rieske (2Fe-2S) protein [Kofleriaceae bacterium]
MKRAEGLVVTVSRREFCTGLASCLGIASLASCIDSSTVIQTGPLGGPEGSGSNPDMPDAGSGSNPPPPGDGGVQPTCPSSGVTDVGAPTTFQTNTPVYFSSGGFFVVRDSGGLYALTSKCTHEGATIEVQGSDFYCPRHGAKFTFDGDVVSGPVFTGLVHYAMCTLAGGHVGVIKSQTVSETQRLNA